MANKNKVKDPFAAIKGIGSYASSWKGLSWNEREDDDNTPKTALYGFDVNNLTEELFDLNEAIETETIRLILAIKPKPTYEEGPVAVALKMDNNAKVSISFHLYAYISTKLEPTLVYEQNDQDAQFTAMPWKELKEAFMQDVKEYYADKLGLSRLEKINSLI